MHRGPWTFLRKTFFFLLLILSSLVSVCQPPTIPAGITLPPGINPQNLPNQQLTELMKDANQPAATGIDMQKDQYKNKTINKDSLTDDAQKIKAYNPRATYGANTFFSVPNMDLSELSTPPLDYPIGVGDHVIVSMYGGAEIQTNYIVGSDGAIFPQGMGKIYVGGTTFENVRRMLYSRFSSVVPQGTNIDITLGAPRSINVNVVNEVNNPGIQTVSAFSNAFNVIAKAGGITENGNLRNIQIKRNGRVIEELDVYKYLQSGDFGRHIYLQNNDFIIVPFYEKKVFATGQFKRPMFYQLRKNEGVKALLQYSGGLNADALASSLKIQRTVNEMQTIVDVNANAILNFSGQDAILQDGDIVKVDLVRPGITNKVEIRGEVKYPDMYQYREGDKLFDIINRAGGITKNTYLNRAYIFRNAGDSTSLKADKLEVDLSDVNSNKLDSKSNVALLPNDIIQIFSVSEFADPVYVEIFGEVRKEGKVRKYGGMTLQDLIYLSGGLRPSAEYGRLEISSVVDMDSAQQNLKPTRTIVKSYAINPNLQLDSASGSIVLKPYDQIFVRKNPTFELQQNIEIKGMVKYPGLYPRLSKSEKISSFIERAGGFKENANLGGAVLYRRKTENLREKVVGTVKYDSLGRPLSANATTTGTDFIDEPASIDLYNALKHKNSKFDIVLQQNDMIFVPEINPFVTVNGIVQSPLKIAYDKEHTHVPFYIDKAGGYGVKPWRRRVFVTYANGRSRRTKNFMFFHFYPRVEEGSFITVPRRPDGAELGDVAKTVVTSIIPVLITALILKYTN